jgi:hypothetical protein
MGDVKTEKDENTVFKQIFPILGTWLLCQLKFLIPKVNYAPPPPKMLVTMKYLLSRRLHSVTKFYTKAQHNLRKKNLNKS